MPDLHAIAKSFAAVEVGVACTGTSLESRTYSTAKKSFLFVSKSEARLKLADSIGEARELGFRVGANGWTTLPLDGLPATATLRRWIGESHALASATPAKRSAKRPKSRKKA